MATKRLQCCVLLNGCNQESKASDKQIQLRSKQSRCTGLSHFNHVYVQLQPYLCTTGSLEKQVRYVQCLQAPKLFDLCASMVLPGLFAVDNCGRACLGTEENNRFANAGAKHHKYLQAERSEQSCLACHNHKTAMHLRTCSARSSCLARLNTDRKLLAVKSFEYGTRKATRDSMTQRTVETIKQPSSLRTFQGDNSLERGSCNQARMPPPQVCHVCNDMLTVLICSIT